MNTVSDSWRNITVAIDIYPKASVVHHRRGEGRRTDELTAAEQAEENRPLHYCDQNHQPVKEHGPDCGLVAERKTARGETQGV